jgi:DNA-binding NarL/FixJ family response regulator
VLQAGATGYLLKDCAQEGLAQAIRAVKANLTFFSSGLADTVIQEYPRPQDGVVPGAVPDLTHRERQVLTLIGEGQPTRQIAATLGVSVKTVETYRRQLMNKLEVKSVAGLTKHALRLGLVSLGS